MNPRHDAAFSWVEMLVLISVIGVLLALALPLFPSGGLTRGVATQTLSNLKQLHLATQEMEEDGFTNREKDAGWPGDRDGTFTNWARQLVPAYLSTNDFCKLLSVPGRQVPPGKIPSSMSEGGVLVYAVRSDSPLDAVFLTSANFTNSPNGGAPLERKAVPYGRKCFVVFRKAGDGAILQARQVSMTNIIGSYAPLLE